MGLSRERALLEEWKACEATIRNLDRILASIRQIGITAIVALMTLAGTIPRDGSTIAFGVYKVRMPVVAGLLTTFLTIVVYLLHAHYLHFMNQVVQRQRNIEKEELKVGGQEVLKLGRSVTTKDMPCYMQDPWGFLFGLLTLMALLLTIFLW